MNVESFRAACLALRHATEGFPFGEDVLVFKVGGKMFALLSLSDPNNVNLKCDPERAIELRERHPEVTPGYHMNKVHWNTVEMNAGLSDREVLELLQHSYDLIFESLPTKIKKELSV